MKVTFPHMGNLHLFARALLEGFGLDVVVPPPCTRRTATLGTARAPEYACFPLKLNLGNFLEAAELGADTIVMAGGVGPCRFGYYAQVEREILEDIGCPMEMVVLEPPDSNKREVFDKLGFLNQGRWQDGVKGAVFAWKKARAVDTVEMEIQRLRPREQEQGSCEALWNEALITLDAAGRKEIQHVLNDILSDLRRMPLDRESEVLKVAVVGEIYTVLEPAANLDLEKRLGQLGVEVRRSIYLSQWINDHLLGGILRCGASSRVLKRKARPYLGHFVGGHGRESVGGAVEYARRGFDGIIQVAPLTCMPEIVAHTILTKVGKVEGIPILTLYFDEQTGEAGLQTRLEAFVDLMRSLKKAGGRNQARQRRANIH